MYNPIDLFPLANTTGQTVTAITSASISLSATPGAQYVEISVTQPVYVTFDGTLPSAGNGIYVPNNGSVVWTAPKAFSASICAVSGTSKVYAAPLVRYQTEGTYVQSLCAELLTKPASAYPINPGF